MLEYKNKGVKRYSKFKVGDEVKITHAKPNFKMGKIYIVSGIEFSIQNLPDLNVITLKNTDYVLFEKELKKA